MYNKRGDKTFFGSALRCQEEIWSLSMKPTK